MKTMICEEPGRFALTDTAVPRIGPNEALVRVRRVGICGTDLHAYRGVQPYFTYPRILGHELSGEIAALGEGVNGFRLGDIVSVIPYLECGTCGACRRGRTNCCMHMRVLGVHEDGGMREYIRVPADHLLRAEGLTLDEAAVVECFSIGAHAVRRAAAEAGAWTLVIGAGPIGLGAMRCAKLAGAKVIALDLNEARLAFCARWAEADATVNGADDPLAQVLRLTDGELPATVIDATGNARSMEGALSYVSHGGTLVYVGLVKGTLALDDPELHKRETTLLASRNATKADFETVMGHMRAGRIDTEAFITHRAGLDGMIAVYDEWLRPETGVIKAIVEL